MTIQRTTSLACIVALVGCAGAAKPLVAPSAKCAAVVEPAAPKAPSKLPTPEEALARLFTAATVDAAWFAPSFLEKVPTSMTDEFLTDMKMEAGELTKVERQGKKLVVVLVRGKVPARISLDAEGRIDSLWLSPPEIAVAPKIEDVVARLRTLPGKASVLVLTDGKEVAAHDADTPMAVGSAFKLAILDALRGRIDSKKARWTDIVRLDAKNKSLPSGQLQSWPDGSPLTLHTLAGLMISRSDNTATDTLLEHVGRDAVEKLAPGNAPFMSTRDAFVLKEKSNAPLLERWRAADAAARRSMLAELAKTKLGTGEDSDKPTIDVEWMFSARRLCELMARTKDLDVMHINPGIATAKDWDLVAYKAGSERGVRNYTTWVEKAGKKHCVATTWNDPDKAVDDERLSTMHDALLLALRDRKP